MNGPDMVFILPWVSPIKRFSGPNRASSNLHVAIPVGALDQDPGVGPQINIFTANKAPWYTISDSLPSIPGQESQEFWLRFIAEHRRAPNHCVQPTPQSIIKFAYANLSPVWCAADAGC